LESGALIVASDSEVKLFKSSQEHTHTDFSTFKNYPVRAHDLVSMKIRSDDLKFLLSNLTVSNEPALSPFWSGFIDTYDSQRVQMPYIVALQAVQTLGNDAVKQY
jgi:propanediol utilization protein